MVQQGKEPRNASTGRALSERSGEVTEAPPAAGKGPRDAVLPPLPQGKARTAHMDPPLLRMTLAAHHSTIGD